MEQVIRLALEERVRREERGEALEARVGLAKAAYFRMASDVFAATGALRLVSLGVDEEIAELLEAFLTNIEASVGVSSGIVLAAKGSHEDSMRVMDELSDYLKQEQASLRQTMNRVRG